MSRKIALKRLRASDLSFFESYFRTPPDVKQKGFNLDAKTLVDKLYPSLPEVVETLANKRVPLDTYFFGPGLQGAHNLQRKILKQQKNWRLNGEFVAGPVDFRERYDEIQPGDFALFEFSGASVPTGAKILLIAAGNQFDASIHAALNSMFPEVSMVVPTNTQIEAVVQAARPVDGHPLLDWSDQNLTEDVALGGTRSIERLVGRRRGRGMSPEDLQKSKLAAENVGALGEELVNAYLSQLTATGELISFDWISSVNAISPYDFKVVHSATGQRVIDAKSTASGFLNPIHLSLSEVRTASEGSDPYDIYRVFQVTESSATLRIAHNVGPALRQVVEALRSFPAGVEVDSISVDPRVLPFEPTDIYVNIPEEDSTLD
jgi:hypothetical protein